MYEIPPKKDKFENWKVIYEDSKEHNKEVDWIQNLGEKHLKEMLPVIFNEYFFF